MPRTKLAAFDLKGARESRGLSQAATAEILCTTQASVSRWESEGDMPAIYRKAWIQHWLLERKANGKANRSTVKRVAGSSRRSDKIGDSKERNKRGNKRARSRTQKGDTDMPVSDSVQLVQCEE